MKVLPQFSKLLLLLYSLAAVAKSDDVDCTKFVDELSTFCRYNKNTGVNQLRKIRFLTDKKTLKKGCNIFKDIPNTDIEECEEEEEENKNIKMLDFFSDKQDDYNIFNIVSHSKDGSVCEDCVKWVLNKDTIDIFPEESTTKNGFSSFLEMEIQTFENLEKKSFLLINFAYSNDKVGNGLRILVNGATKLDLTKSVVSSKKTIGYKLKLKPNKSYLVQIEYAYNEQNEGLRLAKRQMIDDGDDDDTPSSKSFAQIKLLYLKRGDFLKFTGNVKGEPDDDEDEDDEKTTENVDGKNDNAADNDNNLDGDDDNSPKDDDDNTKNIDNDSNLDAKPSEDIIGDDKTPVNGDEDDNNGDDNDNAGDDDNGDDNGNAGDDDNNGDDNNNDGDNNNAGDDNDNVGDDNNNTGDDNNNAGNDYDNAVGDFDNVGDNNGNDNTGDNNDTSGNDNTKSPEENIGNEDGADNTGDNVGNVDNSDENAEVEKASDNGSGFGNKALIIGGIGIVASIFYCRSSASSKAKRQYAATGDNLELDDLEKGIVDIDRELDYDEDDMNHTAGPHDLDADEEAFFEEMSDDDEGYETYGFTKF